MGQADAPVDGDSTHEPRIEELLLAASDLPEWAIVVDVDRPHEGQFVERRPISVSPRIAQQINKAFGIEIDKDVVRR